MGKSITLNIITGFLGAGKTTFVQNLVRELQRRQQTANRSEKVVYIANELGSVGLDADLIREQGLMAFDLMNGCVCCTLKADFNRLLQQVIEEQAPDRIIFEPSGLFALSELFQSLSGEQWTEHLRFGAIVCLIDARRHRADHNSFIGLQANQAALSDILAVSKLGRPEMCADEPDVLLDILDHYPDKQIITRAAWDLQPADWTLILDWPTRELNRIRQQSTRRLIRFKLLGSQHHPELAALSIPWTSAQDREFITTRLEKLTAGQYGDILRVKGNVELTDGFWQVQIAGGPAAWRRTGPGKPQQLVILGNALNTEGIQMLFG